MFEVIISTISSGRVQRKLFDTLAEAERCAGGWDQQTSALGKKTYRVEVQYRDVPAVKAVAGVVTAARATTGEAA